jgi:hypothetical protein
MKLKNEQELRNTNYIHFVLISRYRARKSNVNSGETPNRNNMEKVFYDRSVINV